MVLNCLEFNRKSCEHEPMKRKCVGRMLNLITHTHTHTIYPSHFPLQCSPLFLLLLFLSFHFLLLLLPFSSFPFLSLYLFFLSLLTCPPPLPLLYLCFVSFFFSSSYSSHSSSYSSFSSLIFPPFLPPPTSIHLSPFPLFRLLFPLSLSITIFPLLFLFFPTPGVRGGKGESKRGLSEWTKAGPDTEWVMRGGLEWECWRGGVSG